MLNAKAINSPMKVGVKFIQLDMPFTHIEQVVMASICCAQAISSSLFFGNQLKARFGNLNIWFNLCEI
jgi:hypothetical protein